MKDTGGSAFPAQPAYKMPDGCLIHTNQGGMTLRDYFAAKAMQTILLQSSGHSQRFEVAECAYETADAMLAARGEV